jgi:hypothetical protein
MIRSQVHINPCWKVSEEDTQAVKDDYDGMAAEEDPGLYDIKTEGYEADVSDDLTNVSLA